MNKYVTCTILSLAGVCATAVGQNDSVTVEFSNPERPGKLIASLISGSITVTTHNQLAVVIEARVRGEQRETGGKQREGLKRLSQGATGLSVTEQNNEMSVQAATFNRAVDLAIKVPADTSLRLHTINNGKLEVDGVSGEVELNNVNGNITATNISGSVVAESLNGEVKVSLAEVDSEKPMSFTTFNGNVDLTLPSDTPAHLLIRSDQGAIFTGFEVQMDPTASVHRAEIDERSKGGKYSLKIDKTIRGTINGGGVEITLRSFQGDIYIRRGGI